MRHTMKPRSKQARIANGAGLLHQDQERRLKRIFGVMRITQNPSAHAQDHRPVTCDQRLKRGRITPRHEPPEQPGLVETNKSSLAPKKASNPSKYRT